MKHWQVDVTVHGATPPTGKPVIALTYIIKADSPVTAIIDALNCAKLTQAQHPRKYKNATFTVNSENIKEFRM